MAAVRILHKHVLKYVKSPFSALVKPTFSENGKKKNPKINTNFDDPNIAFKSRTTWELMRALTVYQLLSIKPIVEYNNVLMKISRKILGDKIFSFFMKITFYGHFVAGEDEKAITPLLVRMHSFGMGAILDYSVEEDIPHETAENLEKQAMGDLKTDLPQYKVDSHHLDRREKVVSARTFFYQSEAACDRNMENFLKCLECASHATFNTGMSAIKLTALCRPKILLQISEVITKSRMYSQDVDTVNALPVIQQGLTKAKLELKASKLGKEAEKFVNSVTSDSEGVIHLFPWSGILNDEFEINETFQVPDLKTGKMIRLMSSLKGQEVEEFKNMIRRFNTVVRAAKDMGIRIMVDAEQTYFQPAISRLTMEMMRKYNTHQGIVYNTYQNYLLSSYNEIVSDLEQARRQNFFFGCKLVRGAYMEQERLRAKEMNYPDPIQPTYEATSENYHKILTECLRRIKILKDQGVKEHKIVVLVASHNEDTVRLALQKMEENGIAPEEGNILFSQLFGMCDFIGYTLADARYAVYKYVPYGPVIEVLPYLSRRAVENKGVLDNVRKEKRMLRKALLQRIKNLDLNRNPKGPIETPKKG